jgi:hypothetical protein
MVHALAESWRILKFGGGLIDLRPYKSEWPVEIVSRDTQILAGRLDENKNGLSDDEASDNAISEVIQRGWFKEESKEFFEYAYYWDTVDQMNEYVKTEWSNLAIIPENVLSNAQRIARVAGEQVQIRIRRIILIARYRKITKDK